MNIAFLTSGHLPFDDRIFYHMSKSLFENNHSVIVLSSREEILTISDGIQINSFAGDNLTKRDKMSRFIEILSRFEPDVIICSEPLPVLAAKKFRSKSDKNIRIIYDITEWYPFKGHLRKFLPGLKALHLIKFIIFNFCISYFADSFIFGEWYKSIPYRILYPFKPCIFLPYYPNLKSIPFRKAKPLTEKLKLHYSGKISISNGYKNFFDVLNLLSIKRNNLKIDVLIIGWYETEDDKADCVNYLKTNNSNITFQIIEKLGYPEYLQMIKDTDIFIDLRSDNLVNQFNLPIKLFIYLAFGRPVIFSDLKAIRREIDFDNFGSLVKPSDNKRITSLIEAYLDNEELYISHCLKARNTALSNLNWDKIELQFLNFISQEKPV